MEWISWIFFLFFFFLIFKKRIYEGVVLNGGLFLFIIRTHEHLF